jgi:aurora kinase
VFLTLGSQSSTELHMQGDLFDAVKRAGGRLSEGAVVQQVMYPYLSALAYMHQRGIIHR